MRFIEIKFKCICMKEEIALHIEERGFGEDIDEFMGRVQSKLSAKHRLVSLLCTSKKMEYVKIPMVGNEIGAATGGTA